jgi:hypothetical protein
VGSHYQVNFKAVASGYIVPVPVALLLLPPRRSQKTSWTSCSPTLLTPASPKPEDHWAPSRFLF